MRATVIVRTYAMYVKNHGSLKNRKQLIVKKNLQYRENTIVICKKPKLFVKMYGYR